MQRFLFIYFCYLVFYLESIEKNVTDRVAPQTDHRSFGYFKHKTTPIDENDTKQGVPFGAKFPDFNSNLS